MFRLHILPILGNYSLSYLNENKQLVLSLLTPKANSYANFKAIRGYINSVFDWAEELEYIPSNRLHKTISRIKAVKKQILKENKRDEDLTLDEEELRFWLQAFDEDLKNGLIEFKDYVLFYTTFFLSDRKSESYALQWKHVNFETNQILIENALDRFGNVKATKGGKKTIFNAPLELMILLKKWKKLQKEELKQFGLRQTNNQFIFTYNDRKNNINTVLHIDYLNYRMNSIRRRHPELAPASPHKLRHTGATLAKKAGVPIEEISEALTHSDQSTTKTYINTKNTVKQPVGEIVFRNLKKQ
jgi:integrase